MLVNKTKHHYPLLGSKYCVMKLLGLWQNLKEDMAVLVLTEDIWFPQMN